MKNLTPLHLRCPVHSSCPSVHQIEVDGKPMLLIVGATPTDEDLRANNDALPWSEAFEDAIAVSAKEAAIVISPEYFSDLFQTPSPQAQAPSGHQDFEAKAREIANSLQYVIDPTNRAHEHPDFCLLAEEGLANNERVIASALAEAVAQASARWQPIETVSDAYRWHNRVLLWREGFEVEPAHYTGWWNAETGAYDEGWKSLDGDFLEFDPTHWMPLPSAPRQLEEAGTADTGSPTAQDQPDTKKETP